VIALARSQWKIASTAVALGLVGSCAAALALTSGRAPAAQALAGPAVRSRRLSAQSSLQARHGLRLMEQAAAACNAVAYRGMQVVIWRGRSGATKSALQVWHRAGGGALARPAATTAHPASSGQQDPVADGDDDGVLWVSPRLLSMMRTRFQITYARTGTVAGRAAQVVQVRRPGGALAAIFWLDTATGLPLRREIFGPGARMIGDEEFLSLRTGARGLGTMPGASSRPWTARLGRAQLASLRAGGWPLPRTLGGLTLFAASRSGTGAGEVVELSYSDGLSLVSVFIQRGELPQAPPGWRRVVAGGHEVFSIDPDERGLAWSAAGFVYTVIADAPPATVSQAVAALARPGQPGFWGRMVRGLRRLVVWADPFR